MKLQHHDYEYFVYVKKVDLCRRLKAHFELPVSLNKQKLFLKQICHSLFTDYTGLPIILNLRAFISILVLLDTCLL